MNPAYDSMANRPAICEPTGAAVVVDFGNAHPVQLVFGPHSVIAIGMSTPPLQAYDAVPSAARARWNTLGTSVSGIVARPERPLPAYQCTDAKSMPVLPHAPGSTFMFQSMYSVSEWATM